jgi:hypothetical protein
MTRNHEIPGSIPGVSKSFLFLHFVLSILLFQKQCSHGLVWCPRFSVTEVFARPLNGTRPLIPVYNSCITLESRVVIYRPVHRLSITYPTRSRAIKLALTGRNWKISGYKGLAQYFGGPTVVSVLRTEFSINVARLAKLITCNQETLGLLLCFSLFLNPFILFSLI